MAFCERSLWPLVLLYGFGTPVFFRTAFLNQNLLVAQFSFFSFALLFGSEGAPPTSARAGAAGFLAGLALLCDYSALVAVPLLGIYCLYRCVRGARADPQDAVGSSSWAMTASLHDVVPVAAMAAAAAIPMGVLLAYQAWAFGNPIWPAQRYMPPAEYGAEGWYGFAGIDPELLYANLFDLRFGLVPAAPLLLLALAAPLVLRSVGAPELALTVSVFLGFWLLGSATQFARLQWETGVRYLVPVVPFVFLPTAAVVVCLPRLVRGAVTALAVLQSWALAMVREDPITSVRTVLADGPQLPWLKTLERTGDQYGSVAAVLAANPAIMAVAVAVVPVALLWLASRPMRRA
jgi:hypothetical protein